jgi:transcriptional regulator with XRE-family HTH domain
VQEKYSHFCKIMKLFNEKAIIERIKYLRTQYSGSRGKSKFARTLGISASTYSYYENNRIPPLEILLKISEVTGADLNWLLSGRKALKTPISELEKHTFGPNSSLLRKLDDLLSRDPELAEPISAFIELLCQKKGIEKELYSKIPPTTPTRPSWIPVLGRTAAGMIHFWDKEVLPQSKQAVTELDELVKKHIGKAIVASVDGAVLIDLQARPLVDGLKKRQANLIQVSGQEQDEIVEFVQCEEIFEMFPDSFALHIDGDSMSPRINDGDIVILSPSVPVVAQGQIGIARLANQIGVTCKLIRSTEQDVHLIPINERYEAKVVAKKDLLWALAVLCHISTCAT